MVEPKNKTIVHRETNKHIGTHLVADFWDCDYKYDAERLCHLLINAAHVSNSTVLGSTFYQFEPTGCTALILLAESHISAHTWPEYNYIAIDIFTCGKNMKPQLAVEYLRSCLKPGRVEMETIRRGKTSEKT